jgi:protease-4
MFAIVLAAMLVSPVVVVFGDGGDIDQRGPTRVGWLTLEGELSESGPSFAWVDPAAQGKTLRGVIAQISHVGTTPNYAGMVIFVDGAALTTSQINELSEAIAQTRADGRKVAVFAQTYDLSSYLLACAADKIILQSQGTVELHGIGMEEMYLAGMFEKIGIKADFIQIGKFKGADEALTRTGPSEAWSQTIDSMLDDMYDQIIDTVAESRGMTDAEVEKAFADSWTMTTDDLKARGLIDYVAARDLKDATKELFGERFIWDEQLGRRPVQNQVDNPFALFRMLFDAAPQRPRRDSIALINCAGPINMGDSTHAAYRTGLLGGASVGSRTIVKVLSNMRDDTMVKGIVLRIDSPGGSALASEVIWQAVTEAAKVKPVYISVGHMAASGGYYIACAGDRIYVDPASIVGSIGVVGGKLTLGGLYEKIGVTVHRRSRGPMADIFNSVEPFSEQQRAAIAASMSQVYDQFTGRVKAGRGDKIADVSEVAQGRIFTGRQAVANGLADDLGGVELAISDLADEVGLAPGTYDVINMPPPMTLPEILDQMFSVRAPLALGASPLEQAAASLIDVALPRSSQRAAAPLLQGMMQLRDEHVLTLTPAAIVIK